MGYEETVGDQSADTTSATRIDTPRQTALRHAPSHARLWLCAGIGVAVDLITKDLAFNHIDWGQTIRIVPYVIQLKLMLNPGALFGTGSTFAPVFVFASVMAVPFILMVFAHTAAKRKSIHIALGLVLAGAIGNLYDRVFVVADVLRDQDNRTVFVGTRQPSDDGRIHMHVYGQPSGPPIMVKPGPPLYTVRSQGVVRDFLKFDLTVAGRDLYPWVFNIADALLVAGVAILLLNSLKDVRVARRRAAGETSQTVR